MSISNSNNLYEYASVAQNLFKLINERMDNKKLFVNLSEEEVIKENGIYSIILSTVNTRHYNREILKQELNKLNKLYNSLADDGYAILLVPKYMLFSLNWLEYRKNLCSKCNINGIISVNDNIGFTCDISFSILVLSKRCTKVTLAIVENQCQLIETILYIIGESYEKRRVRIYETDNVSYRNLSPEEYHPYYSKAYKEYTKYVEENIEKTSILANLAEIQEGVNVDREHLNTSIGWKYIKFNSFDEFENITNVEHIKDENLDEYIDFCIIPNDILISRYHSPFKVILIQEKHCPAIVSGDFFIVRPTYKVPHRYLLSYLKSQSALEQIKSHNEKCFEIEYLKNIEVPLLSEEKMLKLPVLSKLPKEDRISLIEELKLLTNEIDISKQLINILLEVGWEKKAIVNDYMVNSNLFNKNYLRYIADIVLKIEDRNIAVVEIKNKNNISPTDINQVSRYMKVLNVPFGLLVTKDNIWLLQDNKDENSVTEMHIEYMPSPDELLRLLELPPRFMK